MDININHNKNTTPPPPASEAGFSKIDRAGEGVHRIQIGGLILVSVDGTADEWGMTVAQFEAMLTVLEVPVLTLCEGGRRYVSVYPLELALFTLGLPRAMHCTNNWNKAGADALVAEVHFQTASLLYGTLTREVVVERVRALAAAVGRSLPRTPKRSATAKSGRRKMLDRKAQQSYNEVEK